MKGSFAGILAAVLGLAAANHSPASILATVDPNGTAPAGGTVTTARHVQSSGFTFDGTSDTVVYLGVHMSRTGGNSFYHGFELYQGEPAGGDANRALQIADENTGGMILRLNNSIASAPFQSSAQYTNHYVVKIEFNQSGSDERVSVFLNPPAGTTEAANTAVATASADIAFSHAGFASFVGAAQVSYRNVVIATAWEDLVTTMDSGLLAAEAFDYADGALADAAGGSGWYGPWKGSGTVASGKDQTSTSAFGSRELATNFEGSPTRPLFFSARFTQTGVDPTYALWLQLGDSAVTNRRDARIGLVDGKFSLRLSDIANVEANGDFSTHPSDVELQLVGKLEFNVDDSPGERLTLWVNPTGNETAAVTTILTGGDLGWTTPTHVRAGNFVLSPGTGLIDDIRIGTTWNDVWSGSFAPSLVAMGFDQSGDFMLHAAGLDPAKTYLLKRGIDLAAFPDQVGASISGSTVADLTDPEPVSPRAFYRLEEQP